MPDAGRWLTSMIMRSVFSLRAGTARGPYTAASTTERSTDGEGRAEGRESAAKGARGDPRGGTRRRRVGRTLFPPRGPVRARVGSERSVLSCRIIAGVRPSVRTEVVMS